MKLMRVGDFGKETVAVYHNNKIKDLSDHIKDLNPQTLNDETLKKLNNIDLSSLREINPSKRIGSCVSKPGDFLAIGLNYRAHAEESGMDLPKVPMVFTKQQTCANGPFDDIYAPPESEQIDYEGELGVVIGKKCRRVRKEDAENYIAGYTIVNDVSMRDWQMNGAPASFTMGKS